MVALLIHKWYRLYCPDKCRFILAYILLVISITLEYLTMMLQKHILIGKGKVNPCTGTKALYTAYGP